MAIAPELLAQVRRIQIRTQRMVTDVMAGGYSSVFRGSGIEFDEVREYVEGDEFRSVDWNVTARTGRPHVKKHKEERELTVMFLLDVSASMGFGTLPRPDRASPRTVRETAAEFCACLALAAQRNNDKTGLIAFAGVPELYVPAKKGSQHVLRLIRETLALEAATHMTDLEANLEYAARVQRKRAVVFVVSDFLAPAPQKAMRALSRRHDVIAVRILDPACRDLPDAGLLRVYDPETKLTRVIDTSSKKVRAAWREALAKRTTELQYELKRARVDFLDIDPTEGVAEPLVKFFRMRELRGARG